MSGFTPGPWKVFTVQEGPNVGKFLGVGAETGEGVTDAYGGLWCDGPEQMANARLIAAAPALLEALRAIRTAVTYTAPPVDFGTPDDPNPGYECRVPVAFVEQINAAIASATGEA
jgi:hypothetical protein